MSPRPLSSLHTDLSSRLYSSDRRSASFGDFDSLSSRREATVSLSSWPITPRCSSMTCEASEKSVEAVASPRKTASVRSWKSSASLRCRVGEILKLSLARKPLASTSSAARCSADGTGVSGSRPLPAWSRRVRTPPICRVRMPAARPISRSANDTERRSTE